MATLPLNLEPPIQPPPPLVALETPTFTGSSCYATNCQYVYNVNYDAGTGDQTFGGIGGIQCITSNYQTPTTTGYYNLGAFYQTPITVTYPPNSIAYNTDYYYQTTPYTYQTIPYTIAPTIGNACGSYVWRVETDEQRTIREEKYSAASKRAEELLLLHLTDEEAEQYMKHGYFETKVNDKIYRINKGRSGNVEQIKKDGKAAFRYCIHPLEMTPSEDVMLAQFLMLHSDEEKFLKTANRTVLY